MRKVMGEAQVITLWGDEGERRTPYLTRVLLGRLRVHIFHRGDADPDCHDHPADFWTFPLVSYVEHLASGDRRVVRAFRLHRRRAELAHRVLGAWTGEKNRRTGEPMFCERQIATLVWWGKKRREWGFHTPTGWIDWRTYTGEVALPPDHRPSDGALGRQGKETRDDQ